MSSPAKKSRTDGGGKSKSFYAKQARKPQRNSIEVGDKGFLVTCNFKERDSVREVYHLLNHYHKKLHKEEESEETVKADGDDDDIETQLKDQIEKTNQENKERLKLFQVRFKKNVLQFSLHRFFPPLVNRHRRSKSHLHQDFSRRSA